MHTYRRMFNNHVVKNHLLTYVKYDYKTTMCTVLKIKVSWDNMKIIPAFFRPKSLLCATPQLAEHSVGTRSLKLGSHQVRRRTAVDL